MSGDDALAARMRQLAAEFAEDETFELDDEMVTRLMRGEVRPGVARPGYAEVAELLAAVSAPARPDELRGESAALSAFRATYQNASVAAGLQTAYRVRRSLRIPVLAVITATAIVASTGWAVAVGVLPGPAERVMREVLRDLGVPLPVPGDRDSPSAPPPTATSTASPTAASPPARKALTHPLPGRSGSVAGVSAIAPLCEKWEKQRADGKARLDAEQLAELAAVAGGTDQIAAACDRARSEQHGAGDKSAKVNQKAPDAEQAKKPKDETRPTPTPAATGPSKSPTSTETQPSVTPNRLTEGTEETPEARTAGAKYGANTLFGAVSYRRCAFSYCSTNSRGTRPRSGTL